jgi:hypothetical protein
MARIVALVPAPRRKGRPRTAELPQVLDALGYKLRTGCPWRSLPPRSPPWPTVYGYYRLCRRAGVWPVICRYLDSAAQGVGGREPPLVATGRGEDRPPVQPPPGDPSQLAGSGSLSNLHLPAHGPPAAHPAASLAIAERRIAAARARLAHQRRLIERQAAGGHDTTLAVAVLQVMDDAVQLMSASREVLQLALATLNL